jgi:tRNA threonylcarbamoyladenosine biosynthesis protein TsaE
LPALAAVATLGGMIPARIDLADPSRTEALARIVAGVARAGDVIALSGEMGAGKSVFARAFLRAFANDPALEVPSPTFSLVQPYDTAQGPVTHFDLWRLGGPDELEALGWELAREGIVLVEWPDHAGDWIEDDALRISLSAGPRDDARVATIAGWPDRLAAILRVMARR